MSRALGMVLGAVDFGWSGLVVTSVSVHDAWSERSQAPSATTVAGHSVDRNP